jgi:CspA family cold shock protein
MHAISTAGIANAGESVHGAATSTWHGFYPPFCSSRADAASSVSKLIRHVAYGGIFLFSRFRMSTGKIKWFSVQKGFGFIQPDGGTKDVFLHASAVERAGIGYLSEGQAVSFEVVKDRGKQSAANLKLI